MKQKPYWGNHSWVHGYFVSTVGINEDVIKRYVKHQVQEEKQIEEQQHSFDFYSPQWGQFKATFSKGGYLLI